MPVQAENVASLGTAAHAHQQHDLRDQWVAPHLEIHTIFAVSTTYILLTASKFNFVHLNIFHVGSTIYVCSFVVVSPVLERKKIWRQMMDRSRRHRNVTHAQARKAWTCFLQYMHPLALTERHQTLLATEENGLLPKAQMGHDPYTHTNIHVHWKGAFPWQQINKSLTLSSFQLIHVRKLVQALFLMFVFAEPK